MIKKPVKYLYTIAPPETQQEEFEGAIEYMINIISKIYRNQVLLELNQSTISKFSDAYIINIGKSLFKKKPKAQSGNYARVLTYLANRTTNKLIDRFNINRISNIVKDNLDKTNQTNKQHFYQSLEDRIGLDAKQLALTEGLKPTTNALLIEANTWVEKLRDDTLAEYTANTLRAMTQGLSMQEILAQYDGLVEKRKNHAKFTARNQIANFNGILTKIRAQNLGIEEAEWVTAHDERVRPCHKARDKQRYKLKEGCYSSCDGKWLLPGSDYQCRCTC